MQPWWVIILGRGPRSSGTRRRRSSQLPVPYSTSEARQKMWAWGTWHQWRQGHDKGSKDSDQGKGPKPFIKRQRRTFKAFKRPCPPRFRQTSVMMSCEHLNKEMVLDVHIMYISKDRDAKHDNNSLCELMERLKHAGRCVTCISWFNPHYSPLGQFYCYPH